jgi:hypothetical protein
MHKKTSLNNLKKGDHLGDLYIGGRIILKFILNRVRGCGLDLTGSGYEPQADSCEHRNEPLNSTKGREFYAQNVHQFHEVRYYYHHAPFS